MSATPASGVWSVQEVVGTVSTPIQVIREDGSPYPFVRAGDVPVHIGGRGGTSSGAWDCLMRYDDANAYVDPRDGAARVDIHDDEIGGTRLCTSAQGTGSNDPSRWPFDRFGAAPRGNCIEQVRVKDWGP